MELPPSDVAYLVEGLEAFPARPETRGYKARQGNDMWVIPGTGSFPRAPQERGYKAAGAREPVGPRHSP